VEGWTPTTYTSESHAKSAYPLLGKHAAVSCDKCHQPAHAATQYKVRHEECTDCHRDPHAGQFADGAQGHRCDTCHTVERFQPAKFTLSRHQQTRFPLEGAHVAVACGDCHRNSPALRDAAAYRISDTGCTGCHADPHQPKVKGSLAASPARMATACTECHSVRTWREVASFDHAQTRFALKGAHRAAECEECHRATALSLGPKKVVFAGAPTACAGCHQDVHAGQFAAVVEKDGCESCHDNIVWKAGRFDHQKTSFSLQGAHERVPCRDCHRSRKEVNGRMVMFYKPTPKDCASCHGPQIKN